MTAVGWLPAGTEELFGREAAAEESYGVLTVDVPPASWITALEAARDRLGCTFFDWLSAVDEPGTGFRVTAHVVALAPVRRLLLRTTVPHDDPALPSAVDVYAGAAWHERETHEMFGVRFTDHPHLDHLLLPDGFEGHPLRKDFVLAARVAKAWPGAKEPGEPEHGGPRRRQMLPPGVPDPNEWGPLKGQLPPARPSRGAGRAGASAARTAGGRPRRTRTASEGSASQSPTASPTGEAQGTPSAPPRRMRTAAEGSVSQSAEAGTASGAEPRRRTRSASEGSASQRAAAERAAAERSAAERSDTPAAPQRRARSASEASVSRRGDAAGGAAAGGTSVPAEGRTHRKPPVTPRSPDAPWHHAHPAFEDPKPEREHSGGSGPDRGAEPEGKRSAEPDSARAGEPAPGRGAEPAPERPAEPGTDRSTGSAREHAVGPEPARGTEPGTEPDAEPVRGSAPEPEPESEDRDDGGSRAAEVAPETGGDAPGTGTTGHRTADPETTDPDDRSGGPQ